MQTGILTGDFTGENFPCFATDAKQFTGWNHGLELLCPISMIRMQPVEAATEWNVAGTEPDDVPLEGIAQHYTDFRIPLTSIVLAPALPLST